ncbi:MAG: hypothetical protein GWM87_10500 [Xanthomonadales bacterium]|nr:hypothetical protein [Xanthomonadales bacterium]NIX13317.1 hypothetical protein [Xanthomonadales bacterium]
MHGTRDIHQPEDPASDVLRLADCDRGALAGLLRRYGLDLVEVPTGERIAGSYWGDEEAGLVADRLLARRDTPVHSILHEACHYVCMDMSRRDSLDTDAGGDYDEENAVCYLQIVLAAHLPDTDRESMCRDMDRWGYTFRLGSAAAWFESDAADARSWLQRHGVLGVDGEPSWRKRRDA